MTSLRNLARAVGVDRASALVQAAGMKWPPEQPVSVRQLVWSLGHPLAPAGLALSWDLDVSGKPILHPPTAQGIPANRTVNMMWSDAGAGARKADRWQVRIRVVSNGQDIQGSPFALQAPGLGVSFQANGYSWVVTPSNEFGDGPGSPEFHFSTVPQAPPPGPPPPPPTSARLTLQVRISLPANQKNITKAVWQVSGPGAPTTPQPARITPDGLEGDIALTLPAPPRGQSVVYTVFGTAAFHYDALTGPSGVTGPEDAQVDLSSPAQIHWSGQNLTGLFAIGYDAFSNTFLYTFQGAI